jgi:hypothetical protein
MPLPSATDKDLVLSFSVLHVPLRRPSGDVLRHYDADGLERYNGIL